MTAIKIMCARHDQGLVLFILLHQIGTFLAAKTCMSSIPTVQYVPSCPSTEADWVIAGKRKMCSSVGQNCTAPDKFVYHCLVNSFFNATLEVCAPVWKMNGYCPEFNVPGQRIQQVSERDCTKSSDKCPTQYDSSEVYKYPSCFRFKQSQLQYTTNQTNNATCSRLPHNGWKTLSIIQIVIIVMMVTSAILLLCFRKCSNKDPKEKDSEAQAKLLEEGDNINGEINPTGTTNASTREKQPRATGEDHELRVRFQVEIPPGPTHRDDIPRMEEGLIVAAINLGTTYTKYGYYFVCEERSVHPVRPELFVQPSSILLNQDDEFLSFGDEAIMEYLSVGRPDHKFFEEFHMLDEVSQLPSDQTGSSVEQYANIFVNIFTCLKKNISEKVATKFRNMQITHWILSVPLTWKKDAEDFLKSKAEQAGITTNVHVVKEHQAVLTWLSYNGIKEKDGDSLFVDLGGGSTKVYNVKTGEEMKEESPAVEGLSIWKIFEAYIKYEFILEVYDDFKKKCAKSHFVLYLMCHDMFKNETDTTAQLRRCSHLETLQETYRRINNTKNAPDLNFPTIKEKYLENLKMEMKSFLENALNKFPHSETVYVFGGASTSEYLYQHVEPLLRKKENLKVHRIENPNMAIIGGSIIERINMWSQWWERSKRNDGSKYGHHRSQST